MSTTSDLEKRLRREADSVLGKPLCDGGHLFREAAERIRELEAHIVATDKHQTAEEPGDLCFNEVTGLHAEADLYRIAELETEVARLKEDNKLLLDKLYNADRVHQNLLLSAERPLQEAEAKLKAMGGLPNEWRFRGASGLKGAGVESCADALEALLNWR